MSRVAGFTSTGSKRPEALFGTDPDLRALRMTRSRGCRVWTDDGREYLDFVMALGAVALGYGHPEVDAAATAAIGRGSIGPLSPVDEEALAADLADLMPWLERTRFLKTGAEAAAAAVRLARVATGRDAVLSCGYHGWLDWNSSEAGVPAAVQGLHATIPFNDVDDGRNQIRLARDRLACVIVEPVIDGPPSMAWLEMLRTETAAAGAVLAFDEVKTAMRVAPGGAAERWGVVPDLVILGKAIANGFPLAAVGGRADLMAGVEQTWISSTMATEFVSMAAARATLQAAQQARLHEHLARAGARLMEGLAGIAGRHPRWIEGVRGIPEMCYLRFREDQVSARVARTCAERGLLFKRNAYNFVSLAHDHDAVDQALATVEGVVSELS